MMRALSSSLFVLSLSFLLVAGQEGGRLDSRYSFKSPFTMVRGGTGIPHWDFMGSSVVADDYIRPTPAIKSRSGAVWNTAPVTAKNWEAVIEFRIGGGGKLGADGLALWYVEEPKTEGPVFGSKDMWRGLAILFDTFDNDQLKDNPQITAIVNDGQRHFQSAEDGKNLQFGGCHSQFRNPYRNTKARIKYNNGLLEVAVDTTASGRYDQCVPPTAIYVPPGYYFGMSSATGALMDNHDVYSFEFFNLDPISTEDQQVNSQQPNQQQQQQEPNLQQQQQQQQQNYQNQNNQNNENNQQNQQQQNNNRLAPADIPLNENPGQYASANSNNANNNANNNNANPNNANTNNANNNNQNNNNNNNANANANANANNNYNPNANQQQQQQQQQNQPTPSTTNSGNTVDASIMERLNNAGQGHSQMNASPRAGSSDIDALTNRISNLQDMLQQAGRVNTDLKQQLESIRTEQSLFAETLKQLINSVASKSDLDTAKEQTNTAVQNLVRESSDNKLLLQDLKATINTKLGSKDQSLTKTLEEVNNNVNQLKRGIETNHQNTRSVVDTIKEDTKLLGATIEKSTSFGFWTYFLFVQAIFFFGFLWWRKHKEDANKKLW
eukprot:TRINITY_DN1413_c1_g2_i2.p1 TRINITY_DN1413_c1_g2~~TRINITY_DN1413_c1_g2_i2.p1  ORF type:complete len:609 (+),score=218.58 TRINITY_DN1413_c1_g2_i2:77-1903(+)